MKIWEKPKLIVLVRSTPEEAVLTGCKNWGLSGALPAVGDCHEREGSACGFWCFQSTSS